MAEEKQPQQNGTRRGKWLTRIRNLFARNAERAGFKQVLPSDEGVDKSEVYRTLDGEVGFAKLAEKNALLLRIESSWRKVDALKEKILNAYTHVGPYMDFATMKRELDFLKDGTSQPIGGRGDNSVETREITFTINGENRVITINLPKKKKLIHGGYYFHYVPDPDHISKISYDVAYFGYKNNRKWAEYYEGIIMGICNAAKVEGRDNKKIDAVMMSSKGRINEVLSFIREKELTFERRLKKSESDNNSNEDNSVDGNLRGIDTQRTGIINAAANVRGSAGYDHTYEVVKPYSYDDEGEPGILQNNFRRGAEISPGVDERGWPLEVSQDGKVLIDEWTGTSPRRVPDQFKAPLNALETSVFISTSFDALRDDLRDGRYHPESLTVMEYVMASSPAKPGWGEWGKIDMARMEKAMASFAKDRRRWLATLKSSPERLQDFLRWERENDPRRYLMELNNPDAGLPTKAQWMRKPSHLNPAFDRRAAQGGQPFHIGRKQYYGTQHWAVEADEQPEPFISTRGGALYILDTVTRRMKFHKDSVEMIKLIGQKINGYDIGARPWSMWGTQLPKNPLEYSAMIGEINRMAERNSPAEERPAEERRE